MKKNRLFDFAIGNPPYQDDNQGDGNKTYAAPVYNYSWMVHIQWRTRLN